MRVPGINTYLPCPLPIASGRRGRGRLPGFESGGGDGGVGTELGKVVAQRGRVLEARSGRWPNRVFRDRAPVDHRHGSVLGVGGAQHRGEVLADRVQLASGQASIPNTPGSSGASSVDAVTPNPASDHARPSPSSPRSWASPTPKKVCVQYRTCCEP